MQREAEDLKVILEPDDAQNTLKSALSTLLTTLFKCFYLSYKDFHTSSRFDVLRSRYLIWVVGIIVYSLQLLSLIYPPDIEGWTSFSWWVYFASLTRLDFVLVMLGLGAIGYYLLLGVVMAPVLLFVVFFLARKRKGDGRLYYFICLLSKGLKTFVHLPGLCLFLAVLKYSIWPQSKAWEYMDADASQLNLTGLGPASVAFILVLTVWVLVETCLDYDLIYSRRQAIITARAHSKIEVAGLLGVTCAAISHFYLQDYSNALHLVLCTAIGGVLVVLYLFYMPFFNQFTNFLYGMSYFVLGWGSLVQLLGMFLGSSTTAFVLTISIPLVFCYIYWDLLDRRTLQIKQTYVNKFVLLPSPYLAELAIRFVAFEYLQQKQDKKINTKLKDTMKDLYIRMTAKFDHSKFAAICEFIYVYSLLNHEGLARLKLSKARNCSFDFESDYNEYRFTQLLEEHAKQEYEEVHYVRFRDLYDTAKRADEEACMQQLDFWTELSMEVPVVKTIENMGFRLFYVIHKARKLSKRLLKRFPQNHLALKLFGSFLLEVYNDTEKGQELFNRGSYEAKQLESKPFGVSERFSYFDEHNSIILVSGNLETVGTITYINSPACNMLSVQARVAVGMNVSTFIPAYAIDMRQHNKALLRFLATCSSYEVAVPKSLFLVDNSGFLVEVFIQIRCMVLDHDPFFIVVLKKTSHEREMALFDENYVIQEHTRSFPLKVGFEDDMFSMKGCTLRQAFVNFDQLKDSHGVGELFTYRIPNTVNEILGQFTDITVAGTVLHAVHVTTSAEEAQSWKAGEALVFQELVLNTPQPTVVEPSEGSEQPDNQGKRGILRQPKSAKKKLHITFNLEPEYREIEFTDFKPGKHIEGKVKDAAPMKKDAEKQQLEAESNREEAKGKVSFEEPASGPILDLKDITEFMNPTGVNATPADQMSRISEMIAPSEGSGGRKGGTSVASSAVSANASFTSSAKAQELLRGVNSAMLRFKISFVLTHLVVIAAVLSMMLYLYFITQRYLDVINITDLSLQRIQVTNIAQSARQLQMVAAGQISADLEPTYLASLEFLSQEIQAIRKRIADRVSDWEDGKQKSMYLEDLVITWELINSKIVSSNYNLLNILDKYASHAIAYLNLKREMRTCSNSDLFFIYRNTFGMGTNMMNVSLDWFMDQESTNLSSTMNIILVLGGIAVALLTVFLVGIMLPTVLAVERANQNVWSFFYGLPLDIVQEMIFRCEERLSTTHGLDLALADNQRSKFKSKDAREKIKCTRKWPVIVTRMWLYYALTAGYILFFYYQGFLAFDAVLKEKPVVEELAGQRTLTMANAYFWLQESLLSSTSCSYTHIVPSGQYVVNETRLAGKSMNSLHFAEFELTQGGHSSLGMTQTTRQLMFSDGCPQAWENCSDSTVARGLHSSLNIYWQDLYYEMTARTGLLPSSTISITLKLMHDLSEQLQMDYTAEIKTELGRMLGLIIGITVLYIFISVLFYFLLYIPMANNVRRQITETWELARLIPIDLLERILKALKKNSAQGKK